VGASVAPVDKAQIEVYRDLVESGWSKETIHPSYEFSPFGTPSVGQCGVTSAWLVLELSRRFGLVADYCVGDVMSRADPRKRLNHQCWVELRSADCTEAWIVDLTCDQIQCFADQRVLVAEQRTLRGDDIDYVAHTRLKGSQLADSSIRHRLEALDRAVAPRCR
jgi:hypothetical protein